MNCNESRRLLGARNDGELDGAQAAEVDAHLAGCDPCRAEFALQSHVSASVRRQATRYEAPAGLAARLAAMAAPVLSAPPAMPRRAPPPAPRAWRTPWFTAGLGLACAALLATNVVLLGRVPSEESRTAEGAVAAHVRALSAEHPVDVVSSDRHTVKPWYAGKLDYSPPVEDLARQGFPLTGGRVDYVAGRSVAALVYRRGAHTINVFVWPGSTAPGTMTLQGFHVQHWSRDGMVFWAVSDAAQGELTQLREAMTAVPSA